MFNKISSFVSQHKKVALLLILLTSTALVACDRNSTNSSGSNSSGTGSSVTSSGVSSSEEFNGSEVPNWDLENPVISTASTGLDLGLDQQYFGRTEGDYALYAGIKKFEGATNPGIGYRTFVIINQKTRTEFFRWELDPSDTFETWAVANSQGNYWGGEGFTFEDNTLYATLRVNPQVNYSQVDSRLGGDYEPFINYINTNYATKYSDINSRLSREYRFIFSADLTTKAITILGASDVYDYEVRELFAHENVLYTTMQVYKGSISTNPFESLLPLPTEVPSMTQNNRFYSVIYQLDLEDLSVVQTNVIGGTTDIYPFFRNLVRGFDAVNFDNAGNLFLNMNFNFNFNSSNFTRADIATQINAFNTTALTSTQLSALKQEQIPVIENYYDLIAEDNTITNWYFSINLSGGFNLETNTFDTVFSGSNTWYNDNSNETSYEGNRWQQYFEYEDESYIIENDRLIIRDNNQMYYNWLAEDATYSVSKLYRYNLETQAKTLLLDYDNEGVYLTGIYRNTQGFYLTGVFNNSTEFTTGLGKAEAFLRAYNTNFIKTGEVVLSGSEDDIGQGITLDGEGKPVWVVTSNSVDGDFAEVGAGNTNGLYRQYFVRFN